MSIDISANYRYLNAGAYANIVKIMQHGRFGGSGKFVIFDTDFALNAPLISSFGTDSEKYDIDYYYRIASEIGFSALMGNAPVLEYITLNYPAKIPLILRLNAGNILNPEKVAVTRPVTATLKDALHVGASAVCFTVYPSSERSYEMLEDLRDIISEAHDFGLPVIVEVLPCGGFLSRLGEGAIDVISSSVRVVSEMGADLIKSPYPHESVENPKAKKDYEDNKFNLADAVSRLNYVSDAAFASRRLLGITLTEYDDDKTVSEIKDLTKSTINGLFISALAMRNEKISEIMSVFGNGILSSEMPLFGK